MGERQWRMSCAWRWRLDQLTTPSQPYLCPRCRADGTAPTEVLGFPVSETGSAQKTWDVFNSFGGIVFAFSFSFILIVSAALWGELSLRAAAAGCRAPVASGRPSLYFSLSQLHPRCRKSPTRSRTAARGPCGT